MVPPRLQKNAPLRRTLAGKVNKRLMVTETGLLYPAAGIPIDSEPLMSLFKLIGRGLLWYHWGRLLDGDTPILAGSLDRHGEGSFSKRLRIECKQASGGDAR